MRIWLQCEILQHVEIQARGRLGSGASSFCQALHITRTYWWHPSGGRGWKGFVCTGVMCVCGGGGVLRRGRKVELPQALTPGTSPATHLAQSRQALHCSQPWAADTSLRPSCKNSTASTQCVNILATYVHMLCGTPYV